MCDTPIARITGCVLIRDVGRLLPLELQCSYQSQKGDVRQYVRGNYKTLFLRGQNLTAVEGNASAYQVYPVSRITGAGRAEFFVANLISFTACCSMYYCIVIFCTLQRFLYFVVYAIPCVLFETFVKLLLRRSYHSLFLSARSQDGGSVLYLVWRLRSS